MWLNTSAQAAQHRKVIDSAIEVAAYLHKNEDLRINQALTVISMCLPSLFSFSAPEFFNKMADHWADKCRDRETEASWTNLQQRQIFTWTTLGKTHHSTVSKAVKSWANLMAARLQVLDHNR